MNTLTQHPLSAAFPAMSEAERRDLVEDIRAHGLRSSVVLYEGMILDGWHRYRACLELGRKAISTEYTGIDPVAYVKSHNWHRRHLTESQRAAAIVKLREWKPAHRPNNTAPGADLTASAVDLAKEAGVSKRTIEGAKKVEAKGSEALKEAVKEGKVSVKVAEKIAAKPADEQPAALADALKPKVKAKPKPTVVPDDDPIPGGKDDDHDLVAELERADKKIRDLEYQNESLQKSDLAKELASWQKKYGQLEGRLHQEMASHAEAVKQATYSSGLLARFRKALGVEKNNQILSAVEEHAGLVERYNELRETNHELIDEIVTYEAIKNGDGVQEMKNLREELRVAKVRMDGLMTEKNELIKTVKWHQRKAG